MSTHEFLPGDRVRLTAPSRARGYQPGDKGTVRQFRPPCGKAIPAYYIVAMDRDPLGEHTLFRPDEIELDV
jgi:hypothetical protein